MTLSKNECHFAPACWAGWPAGKCSTAEFKGLFL